MNKEVLIKVVTNLAVLALAMGFHCVSLFKMIVSSQVHTNNHEMVKIGYALDIDKQSYLNKNVFEVTWNHFYRGGTVRSLAPKLGVTRKTIYYWKRKYPDYADCIEWARGRLLWKYEQLEFALATGIDFPERDMVNITMFIKNCKRLFPEYYNPSSKKFKDRIKSELGV